MPGATTQANPSPHQLDLKLIDETYGSNADLYEDVLRVSTTATQDEIQLAYFDRRSELFTLLAKIDAAARGPRTESAAVLASADQKRYTAERKMDSVVFAVRILADPALRKAYNGLRSERASASASIASESSRTSGFPEQEQSMPRVVTPTESPSVERTSSSQSESKNWIQSAFSASLFGNSHSKTEDEGEEPHYEKDEDRNRRKSKRRFKQQRDPDREEEHEKKSIWGRKKRKKKKQNKEEHDGIYLNDSLDTNATDTSMTDYEDTNRRNKSKTPTHNSRLTTNKVSPQEAVLRGARSDVDTFDDNDTRQDDDTRTYFGEDGETFATLESATYSNDDLQEKSKCGNNGMFGCFSGSKAFRRIANEVSGACEDTLISVDQVFNAFTLTDKDIKAVKKKIEKAKKQLDS